MLTSAHRLHALLTQIRAQQNVHMPTAWSSVLDVDYETPEFGRRHSAVVGLLTETLNDLACLPAASRDRYLGYAMSWWRAVVAPNHLWNSSANNAAETIISKSDLDHLANAADLIEARLGGTALAPASSDLDGFAAQVDEWLVLVAETDDLPAALKQQITTQLQHILWLISEAPRFGVSTALRAADETLGTLVRAAHDVKDAAVGSRWKKGLISWVATTTLLTTGLVAQQKMLDASAGVLHAIADNVAAVHDIVDAVEADGPPATGTSKG
ncbi:MAG: Uncharacterized protein JWP14_2280 [Frankiales bacterium]|nr:Uncharacterized protein [Frankiales bacterium]